MNNSDVRFLLSRLPEKAEVFIRCYVNGCIQSVPIKNIVWVADNMDEIDPNGVGTIFLNTEEHERW